jgi:hypothetical protein
LLEIYRRNAIPPYVPRLVLLRIDFEVAYPRRHCPPTYTKSLGGSADMPTMPPQGRFQIPSLQFHPQSLFATFQGLGQIDLTEQEMGRHTFPLVWD